MFLEELLATTGVTISSLETTLGLSPSTDLEALVGLDFLPDVRFLLRDKREFATHLEWSPDNILLRQNTQEALNLKAFKGSKPSQILNFIKTFYFI